MQNRRVPFAFRIRTSLHKREYICVCTLHRRLASILGLSCTTTSTLSLLLIPKNYITLPGWDVCNFHLFVIKPFKRHRFVRDPKVNVCISVELCAIQLIIANSLCLRCNTTRLCTFSFRAQKTSTVHESCLIPSEKKHAVWYRCPHAIFHWNNKHCLVPHMRSRYCLEHKRQCLTGEYSASHMRMCDPRRIVENYATGLSLNYFIGRSINNIESTIRAQ